VTAVTELSGQICQICGDELEVTVIGEPFVACNECAFPVCRPCYEYERREGNQVCPQCKTRYKRIKGEEASTNFHSYLFVFCVHMFLSHLIFGFVILKNDGITLMIFYY